MQRPEKRSLSLWAYWSAHKALLAEAPGMAWLWFFICWLTLSALLCGGLLLLVIQRQHEHFQHQANQLSQVLESRLKTCELVLYGMEDLISSNPSIDVTQLRNYANASASRYLFIYTMGFQPLVSRYQRPNFEAGHITNDGNVFQIQDYLHNQDSSWRNAASWRRAAERDSYLPWLMIEPALPARARHAFGMDLLADSVIGPTFQRALRSAEIEVTPALHLLDNSVTIALVQAIYSHNPPSSSPLMRPEEAIGVVTLLARTDALFNLNQSQRDYLDVSMSRQTGGAPQYDAPVFQSGARIAPNWLDDLLPRFERHQLVDTPYSPYELHIGSQLRVDMITRRGMAAAVLFAILPSYLILLIIAIRHRAQKSQEFADDSLYRTREHALVTLQAISDAVITIDNSRKVEYLNPAAQLLLGVNEGSALGLALNDVFKLRYEFARHAIADPFIECLQQRKALDLEENSYLLRPNGEKLLIECTVSPLFDRSGGLIGGVLTFRDTAPLRRRMLEALENSEARLRQHESELARVTRITSMGEMASGIAHEINQPLAAIMSYCQASLSLLEDDEPNLELIAKAIQASVAQADRAGKIVRRLREFVSKKTRHHTPVDVNHAVSNALTLAEYDLQSQKITVDFQSGSHMPLVFADTIQLEQVVLNLVRNAIDVMQGQDEPGVIQVETSFSAKRVCIKVGDNGSGISSDKLDNIFAPFFSTKSNGMGLGLTICQTIIESFGGQISAHNRSAGGAEFVVELPPLDAKTLPHSEMTES